MSRRHFPAQRLLRYGVGRTWFVEDTNGKWILNCETEKEARELALRGSRRYFRIQYHVLKVIRPRVKKETT